jgi:hypothetical protein
MKSPVIKSARVLQVADRLPAGQSTSTVEVDVVKLTVRATLAHHEEIGLGIGRIGGSRGQTRVPVTA